MKHPFSKLPHLILIGLSSICLAQIASAQCTDTCDSTKLNTYRGYDSLPGDTGSSNSAFGAFTLQHNTSGTENTAIGVSALIDNSTGINNNALGTYSLFNNSTGSYNTGAGNAALSNNTTGTYNTGVGFDALDGSSGNTALTGTENVALGDYALSKTSGAASYNTAVGGQALLNNTGSGCTAVGYQTLTATTTGYHDTAMGSYALPRVTTGGYNTADGSGSLNSNVTGSYNAAVGDSALFEATGSNNTAIGTFAMENVTTGASNIALGYNAGSSLTSGSNNIDIGSPGASGEAATIRIGGSGTQTKIFVAGIRGVAVSGAQPVAVNAQGQLGVKASSARFKEAIQPMGDKSSAILALHPVSFRYKKALDASGTPEFGLIAEEVAKVDRDLVFCDENGKPFTVRYDEVNAMLLNEFLKEHRTVEAQTTTIGALRKSVARQESQIKALSDGLQKVSARLEVQKPVARVVSNQ
jgi:hypothetical protein